MAPVSPSQSPSARRASPELSIIVPMFNEESGVQPLFAALTPVLSRLGLTYEIVCVDDGSRDGTVHALLAARAGDDHIKVVSLARNFGKEAALTAGLAYASGRAVIPLDADLQDPPEVIPELVRSWREGAEVVLARRRSRASDTALKRLTSRLFYWSFNRLSEVPIPTDVGDFQLLDRKVVNALLALPERNRVMKGLFSWVGFKRVEISYDRAPRRSGSTKWNYRRLAGLAFDAIAAHSRIPLRVASYFGAVVSLFALLYAGFLVALVLTEGRDVPGYASIMVAVLFLGGVQLVTIGIMGEYLGRVYDEVKQRPLYIAREAIGFEPAEASDGATHL